ncbi:MAG: hypothetical protein NC229_08930 [Bacteroides sp.]|nr:hypothetical protein [Bacteroidales bacterium]MCM1068701.1 hypothetical protein [Prevotella sp.]MCM1354767.1 hypothetical protein [Bacteroides sp.]MCM1443682.1 hypothetical protein [Muribaculum sp.]MCM1403881.1 hypothetical protein [Bacteroides sp.]
MKELTEQEQDVLSGMMVVFFHAAERCVQVLENHYRAQYQAGKDYKMIVRKIGKAKADEIVKQQVTRIVRGDERNNIRRILDTCKALHQQMENLSDSAINSHADGVEAWQMFDNLQHDVNFLCKIYALMGNCNGRDDEIKLESTLRTLAKGNRVSERIIEEFKQQ